LKQNIFEHPFSNMFQNDGSLFQLEMKGHLSCLRNTNSLSFDGCWSCTVGIAVQTAVNNCFLTFCLGCSSIWGLLSGLEDLFCKETHIHVIKIILRLQSRRIRALGMIWGSHALPRALVVTQQK